MRNNDTKNKKHYPQAVNNPITELITQIDFGRFYSSLQRHERLNIAVVVKGLEHWAVLKKNKLIDFDMLHEMFIAAVVSDTGETWAAMQERQQS